MSPTISAAVNAGKKLISRPIPVIAVIAVRYALNFLAGIVQSNIIAPAHTENNIVVAAFGITLYLLAEIVLFGLELCAVLAAGAVLQDKKIGADTFRNGFRPKAMLTAAVTSLVIVVVAMVPGYFLYQGAMYIALLPDMPNLNLSYWLSCIFSAVLVVLGVPAEYAAVRGSFIGEALGAAFSTAKRAGRSFWAVLVVAFVGSVLSALGGLLAFFGIYGIAVRIISAVLNILASAYLIIFLTDYAQRFSKPAENAVCEKETITEPDDDPLPEWFSEIEQPVEGLFGDVTYTCETESPYELDPMELLTKNNANHCFTESFALRRTLKKYYTDCCDSITTYADYSQPRTESRRELVKIDGKQVVVTVTISTTDGNHYAVTVALEVAD